MTLWTLVMFTQTTPHCALLVASLNACREACEASVSDLTPGSINSIGRQCHFAVLEICPRLYFPSLHWVGRPRMRKYYTTAS